MILVLGPQDDPMVRAVYGRLEERGRPALFLPNHLLPGSVPFHFRLPGWQGAFELPEGPLPLGDISAVYHRLGFTDFQAGADFTPEETRYVTGECLAALNGLLNTLPALVVNRPVASGSNASKPYQVALVERFGFRVPRTLVTNLPESARQFYESLGGEVVYKSISYSRSIVQRMKPEDLERLDTLRHCPVQLQERVEGTDVRVHVVGEAAVFASLIRTEASDYRYDRSSEIEPWDLGPDLEERCRQATRALGLTLSGIDLRLSPEGEAWCFEVNPSPAFTWYEERTGQPITDALCDVLEAG
ncbi:MAG TPA: alpha-L-glutamate ligase [Candidatus Nitrosotenuis sp.]|nr:alpha-L-glutamate ligase [Candidatus Nitrosotenuis sp.]